MNYVFDIEYATEYGLEESIMLQNFMFWISKNKANEKNYHDGHYWTFNSIRAYSELFPFWNEMKIKRILTSLVEKGVLIKGNYNKLPYDRTNWYAFADEEKFIPSVKYDPGKGQKRPREGANKTQGRGKYDRPKPYKTQM